MPPIESQSIHQKAVRWPKIGTNEFNETTVSAGVEIAVRWQSSVSDSRDPQATKLDADAVVLVKKSQVVAVGDVLRSGSLASVPSPPDDLYEVVGVFKDPDIKARHTATRVALKRYNYKNLPTIG